MIARRRREKRRMGLKSRRKERTRREKKKEGRKKRLSGYPPSREKPLARETPVNGPRCNHSIGTGVTSRIPSMFLFFPSSFFFSKC